MLCVALVMICFKLEKNGGRVQWSIRDQNLTFPIIVNSLINILYQVGDQVTCEPLVTFNIHM
jgi:hypothetical protein